MFPNEVYTLTVDAWLSAQSEAGAAATATGVVKLAFIPEPSTALLLAFGLVGIAAGRRRKA